MSFITNYSNAVAGWPRERLEEALEQLVRSELVFRRGEIRTGFIPSSTRWYGTPHMPAS